MIMARGTLFRRLAQASVLAVVASFGAAGEARANLILQYFEGPSIPPSFKPFRTTVNGAGTVTTFDSTPIEVKINLPTLGVNGLIGYMKFENVHSVGVNHYSPLDPDMIAYEQDFVGVIKFSKVNTFTGAGNNILTATFTNPGPPKDSVPASFTESNPTTAGIAASSSFHPDTLIFTSDILTNLIVGTEDMSLALNSLEPPSSGTTATTRAFKANGSGNFGADLSPVPEPSTLVGAALAGLVALGLRRRRTVA